MVLLISLTDSHYYDEQSGGRKSQEQGSTMTKCDHEDRS